MEKMENYVDKQGMKVNMSGEENNDLLNVPIWMTD